MLFYKKFLTVCVREELKKSMKVFITWWLV